MKINSHYILRSKVINRYRKIKNNFEKYFDKQLWLFSTLEDKNFYTSFSYKSELKLQKNDEFKIIILKLILLIFFPFLFLFIFIFGLIFILRFYLKNNINNKNRNQIIHSISNSNYFFLKHLPNENYLKKKYNCIYDKNFEDIANFYFLRKKKISFIFKNIYFYKIKKNTNVLEFLLFKKDFFFILFKYFYLSLINTFRLLKLILSYNKSSLSHLNFIDILNTVVGKRLIEVEIYRKIFKNLSKILPNNSKLIYVSENQYWEKILNFYLNDFETIAFIQNKNRFWDLKYCYVFESKIQKIYLPKIIICKFKDDITEYKKFNYYSKFYKIPYFKNKINFEKTKLIRTKKIIIFGDYQKKNSLKLLNEVNSHLSIFKKDYEFFFKKHPNQNFDIDLPQFIKELKKKIHINKKYIAIVIDTSSVGLDNYINNNVVLTILSDNSINMSPLYSLFDKNLIFKSSLKGLNLNNLKFIRNNKLNLYINSSKQLEDILSKF